MAFERLKDGLQGAVNSLRKAVVLDKKTIREYLKEIQKSLISSDVNVQLVLELSKRIEDRALLEKPPGLLSRKENLVKITYDELVNLVGTGAPPGLGDGMRVLLVGVQGSGKTTTAAKLAQYYRGQGKNAKLICADPFRPAAYTQLEQLADEIQAPFYGETGEKDTLRIIENGLRQYKNQGLIIIDSEGRHKMDASLMQDINRIAEKINPDRIILVLDGTIGQQAGQQAETFSQHCSIDGLIISKLDGTAKGGGAIAACAQTKSPIYFIGQGEHVGDLEVFDPQRFVSRLLGLGDLEGLLEKAKQVDFDEESAKRMLSGKFTLDDVYQQIQQMQGMGSMDKIMEMLPMGAKIPPELMSMQEEKIRKFKHIMDSMTPAEKEDPTIIKQSRVERIARGSGTQVTDVRELLNYYKRMKKMMKGMGGGRKLQRMMKQFGLG
jgi:signal recognition particle subunit SRP54